MRESKRERERASGKWERKTGKEQRANRKRLNGGTTERGSGRYGGKGREEEAECVIMVVSLKEIQTGGGEEERGSIENSKQLDQITQAPVRGIPTPCDYFNYNINGFNRKL